MKLSQPLYQLVRSLLHPGEYHTPPLSPWRTRFVLRYLQWQKNARLSSRVVLERPEKLCIILLGWKRMHNMEPIVRSLLRADFIERIIVSNNNPEYRISDWITLRDERLRLVDQPVKRAPGLRFELARAEASRYFMSIDDDVFLYPEQVKQLFVAMLERQDAPHGIQGERFVGTPRNVSRFNVPLRHGWQVAIRRREEQVDVINMVYGFNQDQVEEVYRLARRFGTDVADMANGEDILLSLSGRERPWVHDVGVVAECISAAQRGVSTWRTRQNFFAERSVLFQALQECKSRPGS